MTLTDTALVVFIVAAVLHSVLVVASIVLLFVIIRRVKQTLKRLDELTEKSSATVQLVNDMIASITLRIEALVQMLSVAGLQRLYKQYKQTRKEHI